MDGDLKKIAIFASGGGSNARAIMEYFKGHPKIKVVLLISNKPQAGALAIAQSYGVDTHLIDRKGFYETQSALSILQQYDVDWLVLAGFLWLVPAYLVDAFQHRILNIHPALLPKYGGKGMYGMHVHTAVRQAGETESGITIHLVNERYDEGAYLFQARCALDAQDSAEDIAQKVLMLEHQYYPGVIERAILSESITNTTS